MTALKELRTNKNLTQREVAAAIGISERLYAYIENGRNPKKEVLIKLAEFYDVTTDFIIGNSAILIKTDVECNDVSINCDLHKIIEIMQSNKDIFSIYQRQEIKSGKIISTEIKVERKI